MIQPGGRWFVPDRMQIMLLVIAVIGLVAGVSFVGLGIKRSAALAVNQAAHRQLAEAEQQKARLIQALADAQQGAHIAPKAYDYFGQTAPGVTTILIKPVRQTQAADKTAGRPDGPPFWGNWWQQLAKP